MSINLMSYSLISLKQLETDILKVGVGCAVASGVTCVEVPAQDDTSAKAERASLVMSSTLETQTRDSSNSRQRNVTISSRICSTARDRYSSDSPLVLTRQQHFHGSFSSDLPHHPRLRPSFY
jgi:hypothetical protein